MNLYITLNGNEFKAEAPDLTADLVGVFRSWLNAQNLEPAVTVEELTEQLRSNTTALSETVARLTQHDEAALGGPIPTGEQ